MTKLFPGLEVINFQINSKLVTDLEAVFQEVIDFRDNLDLVACTSKASERNTRVKAVDEYCINVMRKKLRDVIFKHTNIDFNNIILTTFPYDDTGTGLSGCFAIDLRLSDVTTAGHMMGEETSTSGSYKHSNEMEEEFRNLADLADKKNARFSAPRFGKSKFPISADLYFDPHSAFLIEDFVPENTVENMTAGEIAAIVLHETGHMFTFGEHMRDFVYLSNYFNESKVSLKAKVTTNNISKITEKLTSIKAMISAKVADMTKDTKSGFFTKATMEMFKTLDGAIDNGIDVVKALDKRISIEEGDGDWEFICDLLFKIMFLVLDAIFTIGLAISATAVVTPIAVWLCDLISVLTYTDERDGKKSSDVMATRANTYQFERWADEFVSRLGLSAELGAGLNKITKVFTYASWPVPLHVTRTSTIYWLSCNYIELITNIIPDLLGGFNCPLYEPLIQRIERTRQNQRALFKDAHLPPLVVDKYIRALKAIDDNLKNTPLRPIKDFAPLRAIASVVHLINPVTLTQFIANGNLEKDYHTLRNNLEDMDNNALYATAYKFARK